MLPTFAAICCFLTLASGFAVAPLSIGRTDTSASSRIMMTRKAISVVNSIKVPKHMVSQAIEVRNAYVDYFKRQPGFVSSTFYQAADSSSTFDFINIVVWENRTLFEDVVNSGFQNSDGMNADGLMVLGRGFPEPIEVFPGSYTVIEHDENH